MTANAFDIVCRLDRDDIFDEVPQNKKQKVATGLLLDKLRAQDFAGHLSGAPQYCTEISHCGKTIILAVLDVRMHLIPSLTTMSVPDCTTSFFLSGDTPRWRHKEIACYTT